MKSLEYGNQGKADKNIIPRIKMVCGFLCLLNFKSKKSALVSKLRPSNVLLDGWPTPSIWILSTATLSGKNFCAYGSLAPIAFSFDADTQTCCHVSFSCIFFGGLKSTSSTDKKDFSENKIPALSFFDYDDDVLNSYETEKRLDRWGNKKSKIVIVDSGEKDVTQHFIVGFLNPELDDFYIKEINNWINNL